jgi:hypothetical protein
MNFCDLINYQSRLPMGFWYMFTAWGERRVLWDAPKAALGIAGVQGRGIFTMKDHRRDTALAIKHCLDSLAEDAARVNMGELAHFISLAALAAQDAAQSLDPQTNFLKALMAGEAGHC